jgi:hypothetical protein
VEGSFGSIKKVEIQPEVPTVGELLKKGKFHLQVDGSKYSVYPDYSLLLGL